MWVQFLSNIFQTLTFYSCSWSFFILSAYTAYPFYCASRFILVIAFSPSYSLFILWAHIRFIFFTWECYGRCVVKTWHRSGFAFASTEVLGCKVSQTSVKFLQFMSSIQLGHILKFSKSFRFHFLPWGALNLGKTVEFHTEFWGGLRSCPPKRVPFGTCLSGRSFKMRSGILSPTAHTFFSLVLCCCLCWVILHKSLL